MALVQVNTVVKRGLELLTASPRAARYTVAIGENADYAVLQEITDVALNMDFTLCGDIISQAESGAGTPFMFPSANLASGDFIPDHQGARGPVDLFNGSVWRDGLLAESEDQLAEVIAHPNVYPDPDLWFFIKHRRLLHTATAGRVYLPTLSRTSACQAHERYENCEVWGLVMALEKDGGDAEFSRKYERLHETERVRLFSSGLVIAQEIPESREVSQ